MTWAFASDDEACDAIADTLPMLRMTPVFAMKAEAWTAIADTLEMIQGLPVGTLGLCGIATALRINGLITLDIEKKMRDRISAELRRTGGYRQRGISLFPCWVWRPRAKLARRFAQDAEKECEVK